MVNIVVLLIVAGCAVAVFYKWNVVRASAAVIAAVCAVMVAFNYLEAVTSLAGFFGEWSKTFCFLLLAVLFFVLLLTAITYLTKTPIDLGLLPERIGRVISGLVLGIILSGFLLVALAMSPLPAKYPYSRFDQANQSSPNKLTLNVDGFVTGLFVTLSDGSFSGNKSFDRNFLDKLYRDRLNKTSGSGGTDGASSNQQNSGTQGARQDRGGGGSQGQRRGRGNFGGGEQNPGSQE